MATAIFTIDGMHCIACVVSNERALRKLPGVRAASVDLGARRARVEYDETVVSETVLHATIADNGYRVPGGETPR